MIGIEIMSKVERSIIINAPVNAAANVKDIMEGYAWIFTVIFLLLSFLIRLINKEVYIKLGNPLIIYKN